MNKIKLNIAYGKFDSNKNIIYCNEFLENFLTAINSKSNLLDFLNNNFNKSNEIAFIMLKNHKEDGLTINYGIITNKKDQIEMKLVNYLNLMHSTSNSLTSSRRNFKYLNESFKKEEVFSKMHTVSSVKALLPLLTYEEPSFVTLKSLNLCVLGHLFTPKKEYPKDVLNYKGDLKKSMTSKKSNLPFNYDSIDKILLSDEVVSIRDKDGEIYMPGTYVKNTIYSEVPYVDQFLNNICF